LEGECSILGNLGAAYADLGDPSKALEYYHQSLEISHKMGFRHDEGITLSNMGVLEAKSGDLIKAIDFFNQHYEIAHDLNERRTQAEILENLIWAYTDLKDFYNVIKCCEQALIIDRETENHQNELLHLDKSGMAYLMLGTSEGAIKAAKIAEIHERQLAIARQIKDPTYEGVALGRLGFLYYTIDEKEEGIKLTKQALEIFETTGAPASSINAARELLRKMEGQDQGKRKRRRKKPNRHNKN
jgi:tetratricopeptide (TPR) repeat protein